MLTDKQSNWIRNRKITIGFPMMIPSSGFTYYEECNILSKSETIHITPLQGSSHITVTPKEIKDGFARIKLDGASHIESVWVRVSEFGRRDGMHLFFLMVVVSPFLILFNYLMGRRKIKVAEPINKPTLGTMGFWFYVRLVLTTPLWVLSSPPKKSWQEFKYGMVSHEHEYDYDNPIYEGKYNMGHCVCKQYGCNFITMLGEDGELIRKVKPNY